MIQQPTVVAAFHDPAAANAAVEHLSAHGLARDDVTLHRDTPNAANTAALNTDEVLTGGIVAAFGHLLDGLMQSSPPTGDVSTYRDLVRREGTLVSVRVTDAAHGQKIKALLETAGAERVGVLPQPGLG